MFLYYMYKNWKVSQRKLRSNSARNWRNGFRLLQDLFSEFFFTIYKIEDWTHLIPLKYKNIRVNLLIFWLPDLPFGNTHFHKYNSCFYSCSFHFTRKATILSLMWLFIKLQEKIIPVIRMLTCTSVTEILHRFYNLYILMSGKVEIFYTKFIYNYIFNQLMQESKALVLAELNEYLCNV